MEVNNDIDGLIRSLDDGSTSAFMWEWYGMDPSMINRVTNEL